VTRLLTALLILGIVARAAAEETPGLPAPSPAPSVDQQLAELRRQMARMQQELDETRAVAQRAAAAHDGIGFRLAGIELRFSGFVQADAVAYRQDSVDELSPATGQPLNQTRFLIRRARLRTELDYRFVGGVIEFDGNTITGPTARITNVEVSAWWPPRERQPLPYVMASLGLIRIPFGFEVQEKDFVRFFLERSNVARALFPGEFDLGARLQGGWRFFRYQLAVMNGHPTGELQYPGRDPIGAKDFLGRLGVDVALARKMNLSGGLSALVGTGFHPGSPGGKDVLVWRDVNEDGMVEPTEIQVIGGTAGTPSQNFSRDGIGADLQYRVGLPRLGQLMIYGELMWANNLDRGLVPSDPIAAARTLRQLGWYVAATLELTDYAMVGLRYDRYNPDADLSERRGFSVVPVDASFATLAVAVAARWQKLARLTLEYDHNDNALGRTTTGLPTRLANDALTLRGQVVF
jgi:hypothetical protein